MVSSHNARIAAKRERACDDFMATTATNRTTAQQYLQQTAYDLERAVTLFYEAGGEEMMEPDEDADAVLSSSTPQETTITGTEDRDPISAIMASVQQETSSSPKDTASSSVSFGGKGFSLKNTTNTTNTSGNTNDIGPVSSSTAASPPPATLKVIVVFYKDGFTAQEKETEEEQQDGNSTTRQRQRGVHSLSSSPFMERSLKHYLPPCRNYEAHAQFIDDVQHHRVPVEFRRWEQRQPVPVAIVLEDRRATPYPHAVWHQQVQTQQQEEQSASFGGTGNTLGGGGGNRSNSGSSGTTIGATTTTATLHTIPGNPGTLLPGTGVISIVLRGVLAFGQFCCVTLQHWWRTVAMPIPQRHIVDHSKPITTIAFRIMAPAAAAASTGTGIKRRVVERVVFNQDHTVDDVQRYCQIVLLNNNNKEDDTTTNGRASAVSATAVEFELLAGFPPKVIHNHTGKDNTTPPSGGTLEALGLLNSAIDVRILSTNEEKRRN